MCFKVIDLVMFQRMSQICSRILWKKSFTLLTSKGNTLQGKWHSICSL